MAQIPTTNFTLEVKNTVENIANTYVDSEYLEKFQYVAKEYMVNGSSRGLLLFSTVGSGKSITAASISEFYRKEDPSRKIIILLAKSLQNNFKGNLRKYMFNNKNSRESRSKDHINEVIEDKYKFVSLNAGNMYNQILNVNKTDTELEYDAIMKYDKYLGKLTDHLEEVNGGSRGILENTLLIIDEVHNFAISIKNGSKNAINLYNTIMKTKNIKLLFLSGTPIVNNPFELVPLFNMLKGFLHIGKVKYTLFPEDYEGFSNFFIDKETNSIKNKSVFQNRIVGLVSYYGDYYFQDKRREGFPDEKPLIIKNIPMGAYQFAKYQEARNLEEKEMSGKFKKASSFDGFAVKDGSDSSPSTYRIRSRQISNYLIPKYAIKEVNVENKIVTKKLIHDIKPEDLRDLNVHSPKFKEIIKTIKEYPNQLSYVYTEFVNGEGANLFALVLEEVENYVYWHKSKNYIQDETDAFDLEFDKGTGPERTESKVDKKSQNKNKQKTYALITGNVPFTERENILKVFNSKKNITGDYISLLIISKSGAEGLTFKNIRSIHIMEPFFNWARPEQVLARGSRLYSHADLPKDQQTVQPYLYISTYPVGYPDKDKTQLTTDEELLRLSVMGKKLRDQFVLALIESSIDCSSNKVNNKDLNCYLCRPDNKPLYYADLNKSIMSNNCQHLKESDTSTIDAKKITFDGQTYYYTKDGNKIKIYIFDDIIGNYTELKKSNSVYADLVVKLLDL
jgi:hypothetical protein